METTRLVGLVSTGVGFALLIATFVLAYYVFAHYQGTAPSGDLTTTMGTLLYAAIQALFLGIMGWVGSLLMLRGIDFEKVHRGVGVVTFKVDKGVGIMTQQQQQDDAGGSWREGVTTEKKDEPKST